MSIETDIRAALSTSLGATVNGVSDGALPQGAVLPWVTFNRITTKRRQALGASSPVITSKPLFQFDAWATTPASRDLVMAALAIAVCALPCAVKLVDQRGKQDAETGYWHGMLDGTVNHAGA